MPTFTDSKNRSWRIELNGGLARRLKQEEQLDFFNAWDGKAFAALAQSEEKLIDALWLCCEEQAQAKQIDTAAFACGFASGDVFQQAIDALIEAVVLFTPPAKRPAVEAARAKTREALAEGIDAVTTKLNGIKGQELIAAARRQVETTFDQALDRLTASGCSTSSPASSASTPSG